MQANLKSLIGLLFFLFFLLGCRAPSLDDFREEGEGIIRSLVQTFQTIHNREQLLAVSEQIESLFDRLVSVLIGATLLYDSLSDLEKTEVIRPSYELSDVLRLELNRLYQLEGAHVIIEKCQDHPLQRLDAFERQRTKKKPSPKEVVNKFSVAIIF